MQQVLRQIQEAVEPVLERSLTKRRRQEFLASAGPLFLCLTFIEDALRVLLRWKEQMSYMTVTMRMRAPPPPSEPQRSRSDRAPLTRRSPPPRRSGWLGGLLLIFSLVTQAPALRRPAAQPKRERDARRERVQRVERAAAAAGAPSACSRGSRGRRTLAGSRAGLQPRRSPLIWYPLSRPAPRHSRFTGAAAAVRR